MFKAFVKESAQTEERGKKFIFTAETTLISLSFNKDLLT
mgnify:CR=1 FL=1